MSSLLIQAFHFFTRLVPADEVALVDRVGVAALRAADVRVREEELADVRVEREAVDAVAGREEKRRRAAVDRVARGDDRRPG